MINAEEDYAGRLFQSAREVKNPIVRVIMEAIAQDSLKHSLMYGAILSLLEGESPYISQAEADRIVDEIEYHIKTEAEMVKTVEDLLASGVKDKPIKFLLEAILKDEIYHHILLRKIYDMIIKRETFTESELWNLVWKEAMFHGTPGG